MTSLLLTHLALLTALGPWRCGEIAPLPREIGPWINEIVELPQDQHARVAPLARQQLLKRLCGRARRCDALDAQISLFPNQIVTHAGVACAQAIISEPRYQAWFQSEDAKPLDPTTPPLEVRLGDADRRHLCPGETTSVHIKALQAREVRVINRLDGGRIALSLPSFALMPDQTHRIGPLVAEPIAPDGEEELLVLSAPNPEALGWLRALGRCRLTASQRAKLFEGDLPPNVTLQRVAFRVVSTPICTRGLKVTPPPALRAAILKIPACAHE
ncbi:hypothetical protein KKB55_01735 [Myxococcota bacterium]|nr:hypothetical protein [Myxococcota bacterium]MBU1896474.1 hypothetical protein [Myxococcota bacterium]